MASRSRLSFRTLTWGSPRMPKTRPSIWLPTSACNRRPGQAARFGNARDLKQGGGGRDVGIKAGCRTCHQIHRDRCHRIFGVQCGGRVFHAGDQRLGGGPRLEPDEIIRGIGHRNRFGCVFGIRLGGRGRPAVKISRAGEVLSDQFGANDPAIPFHQAAIGLVRKKESVPTRSSPGDRRGPVRSVNSRIITRAGGSV